MLIVASFFITALLAIYPFAIYPILLKFFRKVVIARNPSHRTDGSQFSLLFCAYNEERSLSRKLENIRELKQRYPELEILAYDDNSTDATRAMLSDSGLVTVYAGPGRTGKAAGMKLLASRSTRDYLVFTDANVILDLEALDELIRIYADSNIGGVCGTLYYISDEDTATAEVGGLYWKLEEHIKGLESRSGNVMGADGSIFSVRSRLYPSFPDNVLDDFTVSMSVIFQGLRLVKSDDVVAYENLVTRRDEEFSRKVRIAARAITTHRSFGDSISNLPAIDRFKYFSHKVLRWYSGFFLAASFILFLAALSYWTSLLTAIITLAALTVLGVIFYGRQRGFISKLLEVVSALVATSIGVVHAYRGRDFTTWNPSSSRSK